MTCRHPVVTRLPNGSYQCQDCPVVLRPDEVPGTGKTGVTMYHSPVTNDHVIPLALGGSNGPENLVIACSECNLRKGDKHPMDFAGAML